MFVFPWDKYNPIDYLRALFTWIFTCCTGAERKNELCLFDVASAPRI